MSKLTKHIEKKYLTQDELAKISGLSVRTIQRIEAGATPRGHSLTALSLALDMPKEQLTENEGVLSVNYKLIKLINLSSLPFVFIPIANIAVPLLIMYWRKEVNELTKQVVSVQIIWTILTAVVFLLSPFISKLFFEENQVLSFYDLVSVLTFFYRIISSKLSL